MTLAVAVNAIQIRAADDEGVKVVPTAKAAEPVAAITDEQRAVAATVYGDLFGEQENRVKATADTADDLDFVSSLITAVDTAKSSPALQSLLLEKTFEAAMTHPSGIQIALKAMQQLSKIDPEREAFAAQRIRAAYEQLFTTARGEEKIKAGTQYLDVLMDEAVAKSGAGFDEDAMAAYREALKVASSIRSPFRESIRKEIEQLNRRVVILRRADQLKEQLKSDPKNAGAALDLVMLYIVEFDNPIEARKYTFLLTDESLKDNIRDAAKEPAEIEPARALILSDWYTELAGRTGGIARSNLLMRTEAYLTSYLDSDAAIEPQHSKAKHALDRTQKALAALGQTGKTINRSGAKTVAGNVALAENGAVVLGSITNAANLIDGNTTVYTGSTGFTYGSWPCSWTLKLSDRYMLREIRMLLWDGAPRFYRYAIDVSKDGENFEPLLDRTAQTEKPTGWQAINFAPRPVQFIRIRGTYNSANGGFHVVELEAYCKPPAQKPISTHGDG